MRATAAQPMIRAAHRGEAAAVLAVWAIARSAAASTPDREEDVERLLARDPDALLVAEVDSTVVGVLVVGFDGWRGNLYRLAVLPPFRRRGVAVALVAEAEARLREAGCRRVSAAIGVGDVDALAFWRAVGYAADPASARVVRTLTAG
jgi:ribosomal protein S18 acetylase RimI-like enzyme